MLRRRLLLVAVGWAVVGTGCFFESSTDPGPPPVGVEPAPSQVTVHWTVDEAADPNLCGMGAASTIDIVVSTSSGQRGGEFQAPCEAFSTTISTLPAGDYAARARLIANAGNPRTWTCNMSPITMVAPSNIA